MDLNYTIRRSDRRRRMTITVERDRSVVIHAPTKATDEQIATLVDSRRLWIYAKTRHGKKFAPPPHPPGEEIVNGGSAAYLGRDYPIELVDSSSGDVVFDDRFLIPHGSPTDRLASLTAWYRQQATETILPRIDRFVVSLGVEPTATAIVDAKYRWGSCTPAGKVTFNWRLIKTPLFVIDYVIVHELAHLIEPNHTPEFWNIVRSQTTRCDEARKWLSSFAHGNQ